MARTASSVMQPETPRRRATRFIVCRTAGGCWIAAAKSGRVTGIFPLGDTTAALKTKHRPRRTS